MFLYKFLKLPFFGRFMVQWKSPLNEEQQKLWYKVQLKSKSRVQFELSEINSLLKK